MLFYSWLSRNDCHFVLYLFAGLSSGVMGFMILFGNISGAALGLFFVVSAILIYIRVFL